MTLMQIRPKNVGLWILGALMILLPMQYYFDPVFGAASLRLTQQQGLQVIAIALFAVFILQNVYLSLFLLWSLFLYAHFAFASPVGTVVLTILGGCLIYEAAYRIVNKDNVKILFYFMIAFALINMIYMIFQGFGWELIYKEFGKVAYQPQMLGFMGLKAIMGVLFAICIPFFAFRFPVLSLGLFIPIYISECSSAMGGAIVAYLWQLWFLSKKWFCIMVGIMCLGGIAYAYHDSHAGMFTDRFYMWKEVLRDAVKKPMIGWGPDSFRCVTQEKQFMYVKNVRTQKTFKLDVRDVVEYDHTHKYDMKKYGQFMQEGDTLDPWDNPHNEYIKLLFEFGLPSLIILGFLCDDIKVRFNYQNYLTIPIIGFFLSLLVISVGWFPFELARIGFYFPIFLGVYYKLTEGVQLHV